MQYVTRNCGGACGWQWSSCGLSTIHSGTSWHNTSWEGRGDGGHIGIVRWALGDRKMAAVTHLGYTVI